MNIQIIQNKDNTYNLSIEHNARILRLHSSRPINEAEKLFSQLNPNAKYYFLGGLGCGYLLEHVLLNSSGTCIVYEPKSPIFDEVQKINPNINKLINNNHVIFVRSIEELEEILSKEKIKDISYMIHRPYAELFSDEFILIQDIFASHIRKNEIGNATLLRFGKIWSKNIFKNMHRYFSAQKLIDFKNLAIDKPAIIIGAGPSLEENIPYLNKYHSYAYLIACDTSLPMLERYGIRPDFVITVDPQEKNSLYLRYSTNKDHYLIADPGIHSSSFEGYSPDNIIMMDSLFPFYQYFEPFWGKSGLLASGGSVSTSAFDFAKQIGASPIIMIGQDLSFAEKKTHSKGNILTDFSYIEFDRLHSCHTKNAQVTYPSHAKKIKGRRENSQVLADARFILFRDWFSEEICKTLVPVIISGLDGAYLKGADHREIQDSFTELKEPINKNLLHKKASIHPTIEFEKYLNEMLNTIINIHKECERSLLLIKKSYTSKNLDQTLIETNKLQKLLETPSNQAISVIISTSIQSSIQKALEITDHISDSERLDLIHEMCTDIVTSIKMLIKNIKKTIKSIESKKA